MNVKLFNDRSFYINYGDGPYSFYENDAYKFKYSEKKFKDIEYVLIDDFLPLKNDVVFPTVVNKKPVIGIRFSKTNEFKTDFINKITIGGNILDLCRFSKVLEGLQCIEIADDLSVPDKFLFELIRNARYSKRKCTLTIPQKFGITQKNDCVLADDDKTLVFWNGKNDKILVPNSVEKIAERSIIGKYKLTIDIVWPKNLKIIEDDAISMSSIDFLKHHKFPKTVEYAGNCCIFEGILPQRVNALVYSENSKLVISDNVKDLSDKLVRQIFDTKAGKYQNFIYSDGLLLSKDKKTLYLAFSEKDAEKEIAVPDSVEKVLHYAFFRKQYLKTIVTKTPSLFDDCYFDVHVDGKIKFSPKKEETKENNQICTIEQSKTSLQNFKIFIRKLGIDNIVVTKANNFDDFIEEIELKVKPLKLNFMSLRRRNSELKNFEDYIEDEFMDCCDNFELFLYFTNALHKNGVLHNELDNSKDLLKFIESEDFDGVSYDLTSNIYLIKNEKFVRKALIIGETKNIPKTFISKNLFKSTKSTYFVDYFDI